jgi:hypothetical protein
VCFSHWPRRIFRYFSSLFSRVPVIGRKFRKRRLPSAEYHAPTERNVRLPCNELRIPGCEKKIFAASRFTACGSRADWWPLPSVDECKMSTRTSRSKQVFRVRVWPVLSPKKWPSSTRRIYSDRGAHGNRPKRTLKPPTNGQIDIDRRLLLPLDPPSAVDC